MLRNRRKLEDSINTKPVSRKAMLEKRQAMAGATSATDSKYGTVLFKTNSQHDRTYSMELRKLEAEIRRKYAHLEQQKKRFIQKMIQKPDPCILVERAPSPEARPIYVDGEEYDPYWSDLSKPGYRRSTRSKMRLPSTLPTIDAYIVKNPQKRNVWEEALDEAPKIASAYVPHVPLTEEELAEIQRCASMHQRPKTVEAYLSTPSETRQSQALVIASRNASSKPRRRKKRAITAGEFVADTGSTPAIETVNTPAEESQHLTTFITELPKDLEGNVGVLQGSGNVRESEKPPTQPVVRSGDGDALHCRDTNSSPSLASREITHGSQMKQVLKAKKKPKTRDIPQRKSSKHKVLVVVSKSDQNVEERELVSVSTKASEVASNETDVHNTKTDDELIQLKDDVDEESKPIVSDRDMVMGRSSHKKHRGLLQILTEDEDES